jgi:hypothetical protein
MAGVTYIHEGLWARATFFRQQPGERGRFAQLVAQLLHGRVWLLESPPQDAAGAAERYLAWPAEDGSRVLPVYTNTGSIEALARRTSPPPSNPPTTRPAPPLGGFACSRCCAVRGRCGPRPSSR